MTTKTIKGKVYEFYGSYTTEAEAKAKAKNLDGRLHIMTGLITETVVIKVPKTKTTGVKYTVWDRKITQRK